MGAKIRYRSSGGAKLDLVADRATASLGTFTLPPASDWTEAEISAVPIDAGEHVLRVTISGGSATLDGIDFHP